MLKTIISIFIAILLFHFFHIVPTFGQSQKNDAVKNNLIKIGIGEKAKVKVEMLDGREIKGYVAELNTDDFVVADSKTNNRTTIFYNEVAKLKKQGWSLGAKLAMASMAIGTGLIIVAAANRSVKCSICP